MLVRAVVWLTILLGGNALSLRLVGGYTQVCKLQVCAYRQKQRDTPFYTPEESSYIVHSGERESVICAEKSTVSVGSIECVKRMKRGEIWL